MNLFQLSLFALAIVAPPTPMFAFSIDPALVVALLVSTVLPVLVGLVTTRVTSGGRKALLLAALALATSLLTELGSAIAAGTPYDVGLGLLLALPVFVTSVAMHYGLWKPVGTSAAIANVGVTAPMTRREYRAQHPID